MARPSSSPEPTGAWAREYITQLLDERGVPKVYTTARNPENRRDRCPRRPLRLDVTEAASVAAVSEAASDVGVLINNAGIVRGASVLSADTTGLRQMAFEALPRTPSGKIQRAELRRRHRTELQSAVRSPG